VRSELLAVMAREFHPVVTGEFQPTMARKLSPVMARLDRAIGINTMLREMARLSRAMTRRSRRAMTLNKR